jgi:hypothetical protein
MQRPLTPGLFNGGRHRTKKLLTDKYLNMFRPLLNALLILFCTLQIIDAFGQPANNWTREQMSKFSGNQVDIEIFENKKTSKFLKKLDAPTLVELTESEDIGIRCYAFMALVSMNNDNVQEIFLKHLSDTSQVETSMGNSCLVISQQVNQFMLDQLHPVGSRSSHRLTREEYEKYKQAIASTRYK